MEGAHEVAIRVASALFSSLQKEAGLMQFIAKYKRKYTTECGESEERWCHLGIASKGESGIIVLFLDALPLPQHDWDGTVMLFPKKDRKKA